GLTVAESFASFAYALWPLDAEARDLAREVATFRALEGYPTLDLAEAIAALENADLDELFDAAAVEEALAGEKEAQEHFDCGRYHLALPQIDRAVVFLLRAIGSTATQTLRIQRLKAYILDRLGCTDETLPI